MSTIHAEVRARLEAAGDPEKAVGQQAYMKSAMPFHGVAMPEVRRITATIAEAYPFADRDEWQRAVLEIWRRATHREERYVATQLAVRGRSRRWLDGAALPMVEEMIVTGAWWDHVDALAATHMGLMLANDPETIRPAMWEWATDSMIHEGAMWRRRTSIICQLKAKDAIDLDLLFHAIEASMDSKEFFLRKAIGWALRELSKTEPDRVAAYVADHHERLSGLSRREAMKHLT